MLRLRLCVFSLLALAGSLRGQTAESAPPCIAPPLVITNVAVADGGRYTPDREVVFANGRVAAIARAGSVKRPAGARLIDARGDTLMPGLIDAHAHLYELGGPSPRPMYESPREHSFPVTVRQLLRSGVTAARVHLFDQVHGPALKRDAENDCYPSPRLRIGGPGIIGGRPELSGAYFHGYRSLDDARVKLAAMRDAGADWVALHGLDRYPPGELDAIAAEARRQGLLVMAEGDPVAAAAAALRIGADSIEYLDRTAGGGYSAELIKGLERSSAYVVAPIGYYNRSVEVRRDKSAPPEPRWFSFMPDPVAREIRDRWSQWIAKPDPIENTIERVNERFVQLARTRIKMAIGTDCGSPANFQVDAIWWELETRRKMGIAPLDAIRSGTEAGAALLRLSDAGRLRQGARADFVLLRGDVRSGALELSRVRAVGKGGVLFVDEFEWTER